MRRKGVPIESLRGVRNPAQIEAAVLRAAAAGSPAAQAPAPALPGPQAPPPAAAPARPGAPAPGIGEAEARELHKSYTEARRQCGQTGSVDFAAFLATLGQRAEAIRAKYGAAEVRFQVAVRDGRPVLQAIPRK
jgi:hypothetical protein